LLLITAIGSWQLGNRSAHTNSLDEAVMTSHVRSLMGAHLTDVVSTDQHTVKPWFNGRIDYSPPVPDFVGRGFPLQGGRLDYVSGKSVAVLVYGRRKHEINLYLWPAEGTSAPVRKSERGYNMIRWTASGYTCWAVSDLGITELNQFTELVRSAMANY
jgi:anti-sigma factor RsiW